MAILQQCFMNDGLMETGQKKDKELRDRDITVYWIFWAVPIFRNNFEKFVSRKFYLSYLRLISDKFHLKRLL